MTRMQKPDRRIELEWVSGQRFEAKSDNGLETTLDGDRKDGFSPMDSLLASLCACMGIDVVMILEKMRSGFTGKSVSIEGDRMEEPPRYFHHIRMHFQIQGTVPRDKAQRAVDLSFEKYCSAFHSLRKDLVVDTTIEIQEAK